MPSLSLDRFGTHCYSTFVRSLTTASKQKAIKPFSEFSPQIIELKGRKLHAGEGSVCRSRQISCLPDNVYVVIVWPI